MNAAQSVLQKKDDKHQMCLIKTHRIDIKSVTENVNMMMDKDDKTHIKVTQTMTHQYVSSVAHSDGLI